ncbi:MAG: nuclear transport factor 2 family protein [Acidobacteriia bacterium]|nr:nuclear transport factor 2 family protein [Terriglobia bacterium]
MHRFAAILVVLSLITAAAGHERKRNTEADKAALRQTELDFAQAFADRNVAKFASFLSEDARFTGGGKVTQGKAAILDQWSKMMQNPNLTLTWAPDMVETSAGGDLGYTSGTYEATVKRPDGTTSSERGRFASVWRRQTDGRYRIVFDIGSAEEQSPAPPKQ